ncbi:rCG60699 [Rattus norvegicus]|uniref:RCG60699 n=1 Tax=Rattus norvegicus TaxID=10116 RepID=A6JK02_RAT|nr:rCG60699 [Rattus norvegicus]
MEALSLPGLSKFTRFMQWPPECVMGTLHPRTA